MTEMRVYDFEHDLAGSIDGVFVRCAEYEAAMREKRLPRLTLFDWKRTNKFATKSFGGEVAAPPLNCFPDAKYYQYAIQLNLYRRIIQRNSQYTVEDTMFLCRFHPSSDTYEVQPVQVFDKQVDDLLALRKAELALNQ
jgi:hypothetical protein